MPHKIFQTVSYTVPFGGVRRAQERIIRETPLSIRINGRHHTTAMILPTLVEEFVIGHLFTQGLIDSPTEIASLRIEDGTAEISLKKTGEHPPPPLEIASDLEVSPQEILSCVRTILNSAIFAITEAVHSAGLFLEGKVPLCIAEDLGRQHALDKVIGYGLMHHVDFRRTVAASTARQPAEMVYKCHRAGIPIIATKGVPTTLAVDIARKRGITIAGLVRGRTMVLYSHPERVRGYHGA